MSTSEKEGRYRPAGNDPLTTKQMKRLTRNNRYRRRAALCAGSGPLAPGDK